MKKKEIILSINPCIYGLNHHDPSVAIVSNGEILFGLEEERINGIKGSKGLFPARAIKMCLDYCNLGWRDITRISIGYEPGLWMRRLQLELSKIIQNNYQAGSIAYLYKSGNILDEIIKSNLVERYRFYRDKEQIRKFILEQCGCDQDIHVSFFEHHQAHIASSYELSGFNDAVGVVLDGIGEYTVTSIWIVKDHHYKKVLDISYPNSLGYFYAIATKFLGFIPWCHEGKTMALSAYGQADKKIETGMKKIIDTSKSIYNVSDFIGENAGNYLMLDEEKAINAIEKVMGFPARDKDAPITSEYKNFAWSVQKVLERSVVNLVNYAIESTGISNVCAAGGIFMNCKMNMVVREQSHAANFFVQPLAGDLGLVIGAGLLSSQKKLNKRVAQIDFGPEYTDSIIEQVLIDSGLKYYKPENLSYEVAKLIASGKIVCWFEGRMEMGARALGHRSILADPRQSDMSDRINEIVKHREKWRPFACSIIEEDCSQILINYKQGNKYPFMIEAFRVKEEWKNRIPAVIHQADGTTRPQTVNKEENPLYYDMLVHFKTITGCPLVLNTSFNDKGQPIIMTPQLAIDFYNKISVDALAIGGFILKKD